MRAVSARILVIASVLAAAPCLVAQVAADSTDPRAAIHRVFEQALADYESGAFAAAYDGFSRIFVEYDLNDRTTAAMLMAAKSLLAEGEFERAMSLVDLLIELYPETRYGAQARATRAAAEQVLEHGRSQQESVFRLGVVLPRAQLRFTQPLVRGILMAVEEHNAAHPLRPAKLFFDDSGETAGRAGDAVARLVREDSVQAIIGPLYSEEAVAAARQANRAGVLLVVPLATDHQVSEGMRNVFQANPTFEMRGRLMARFALDRLRITRFGVIVERETAAEEFSSGFARELEARGQEVRLEFRLEGRRDWYQLADQLGPDTLTYVDAIYAPVTGAGAQERVRALLEGLAVLSPELRLLGNGEWADLPAPAAAARHRAVHTGDYEPRSDTPEARGFRERYASMFGTQADNMAATGYDVAGMLLSRLADVADSSELADAVRSGGVFNGVSKRIDFAGGNVNSVVGFWEYQEDRVVRRD